jgi:hypothetical protein
MRSRGRQRDEADHHEDGDDARFDQLHRDERDPFEVWR